MFRVRRIEWFDTGDLNVFVPGLMAAGILLSIVMLAADAAKRLWPSRGQRARSARVARKLGGRINDLESVARGATPRPFNIKREPRGVVVSIAIAIASFAATHEIIFATFDAYNAPQGRLAQRGWTLTGGFGLALACATVGLLALVNAFTRDSRRPPWLAQVSQHWLLGRLPRTGEQEEVR